MLRAVGEDERVHDFVGPFHDGVDSTVAPNPFEFVFGHEAFTAHHLHGGIRTFKAKVGAEDLADGGFQHDVFVTTVHHAGGVGQHGFHGVHPSPLLGDVVLHEIELADWTVELMAVLGPFRALGQSGPGRTNHAGRECAASVVQTGQSNIQPTAFVVKKVCFGHLDVFEFHPGLPRPADTTLGAVAGRDLDALHVGSADEGGDFVLGFPGLGINDLLLAHHREDAGQGAAGGPFLSSRSNDEIAVLVFLDPRFLATRIATHIGFGKAEGREGVFADAGKEGGFLGFGPKEHDGAAADGLVGRDDDRRRTAGLAEAGQHAVVRGDPKTTAAVLLGRDHAHDAQVKKAREHPVGDVLGLVDFNRRMLRLEVDVEFGEQFVAPGAFFVALHRHGENQFLSDAAPKQVLDEAHGGGIRPQHFLSLLDLLAVFRGDVLQALCQIRLRHR